MPGDAPVTERSLTAADIEPALRLSVEAGWNQTAADWALVIAQGEARGLFAAGRLIASAATIPHGPHHGWVAMVLVTRSERRKGHATRLVRWAVDSLRAAGRTPGLDATPDGEPLYASMGFRPVDGFTRYHAERPAPLRAEGAVRPLARADLAAVAQFDASRFGADRTPLLTALADRSAGFAQVACPGGRVTGYALGRDGTHDTQVGPIVADGEATAEALLAAALARIAGPVIFDVPLGQPRLRATLAALGFTERRPFTRMVLGVPRAEDEAAIRAVIGPEFG